MSYKTAVRKWKEAEKEYVETGRDDKLREYLMYESIDGDGIPDYLEDIDFNKETTWYRFNYPSERFVVGEEKRRIYPLDEAR